MTEAELLALRTALIDERRRLLDRLAIAAAAGKDNPEQRVEPNYLQVHGAWETVLAALDADLGIEHEAELKEA
jgi:hypothetical protein